MIVLFFKKNIVFIIIILALLAINIIIFNNHYLGKATFPWDFITGYSALPVYYFGQFLNGKFPEWMPYQSFGFPLSLMPQSQRFFPFYLLLYLLKIPPTITILCIIQGFHILLSSIGMFLLIKLFTKSNFLAFLSAVVIQFYGGFYSNAQHSDIVRSFSYIPWFFYSTTFFVKTKLFYKRLLILPIFFLFLFTGGYPGLIISTLFIIICYLIIQYITLIKRNNNLYFNSFIYSIIFLIVSILISTFHWGPLLFYKNFIYRASVLPYLEFDSLTIKDFTGLFFNNWFWHPNDPSMTSTFITLPIFLGIAFINWKIIKKYFAIVIICCLSLIMAFGSNSFFWKFITNLFSILKLSRFPTADYRSFFAFSIVILSLISINYTLHFNINRFFIRLKLIFLSISLYIFLFYSTKFELPPRQFLFFNIIFILTFLLFFYIKKININLFKLILLLIVLLNGMFFLLTYKNYNYSSYLQFGSSSWNEKYQYLDKYNRLAKDAPISFNKIFISRPARLQYNISDGWREGKFIAIDNGSSRLLKSAQYIYTNKKLYDWMSKPWEAKTNFKLAIVKQIYYSEDTIKYFVNSPKPFSFFENEIYFPGWSGKALGQTITASAKNGLFRQWSLPAGSYTFITTFTLPHLKTFYIISIFSLIIYIFLIKKSI